MRNEESQQTTSQNVNSNENNVEANTISGDPWGFWVIYGYFPNGSRLTMHSEPNMTERCGERRGQRRLIYGVI